MLPLGRLGPSAPGLAARFTRAEQAVLAPVAAEMARRGDYRLAHEHAAAQAGVSRSTMKNALREARRLGPLTVEERPVTGFRNPPDIVRIVGREKAGLAAVGAECCLSLWMQGACSILSSAGGRG